MTATAWRPPAASTQDWRRDTDEVSLGVEQMIRLGSEEYDQTDWALLQLRLVTKRCDVELVERIDELLTLADDVADQDRSGSADAHHAAIDSYEAALTAFVGPTVGPTFDQDVDVALAVQEPVASAPLTLVRR